MSSVRRVYVEKKPEFAVQAKDLKHEIKNYLGIRDIKEVRILIRYDVENISDDTFEKACNGIFSEPPVDILYHNAFPETENAKVFSVEFLPGQFDQRADSAVQCVKFLKEDEEPVIRTAVTYMIEGQVSDEEFSKIKSYCINPVDSRETGMEKPDTLITVYDDPADVAIFDGFRDMDESSLKALYESLGLAMTFKDFKHIQNYFHDDEKRDPSMTEIRVLDTYWSDHCRHTTFSTELTDVEFGEGYYRSPLETTYQSYLDTREEIFKGREDKFVCLMDLALLAMRRLKKEVLTELPDKIESVFTAQMSPEQAKVYEATMMRLRQRVDSIVKEKGFERGRTEVLAAITQLREICCHPSLVLDDYTGTSGKLDMLLDMLPEAIAKGRRVLLFSAFTSMLKILRRELEDAGYETMYLDGDTPAQRRVEMAEQFNAGQGQIFLISLKAGGTGLNLTGADMVIHYDPWWNPAAEDQATDRAYRIGQTRKVEVIRLVTHASIEEQVVALGQRKKALFDQLIKPGESMVGGLSPQEIMSLFQ